MLELFRTNQLFGNIFLVGYVLILRFSTFLFSQNWKSDNAGILSTEVYRFVAPNSLAASILSILLLSVQALLINIITNNYRMAGQATLLPGLFFLLISCSLPDFLHFSPVLLGGLFYILVLSNLFESYKKPESAGHIFNVGFWASMGSLFYFSYSTFILLAFVGLAIMRAYRFKESLMVLLGFLTPYWFALAYYFWYDQLPYFWAEHFVKNIALPSWKTATWGAYLKIAYFMVLIAIVVFNYGNYSLKKNIQIQKNQSILYWGILITSISLLFQANIGVDHLFLLSAPFGILISYHFITLKPTVAESLHWIWLFAVLIVQYRAFIGL